MHVTGDYPMARVSPGDRAKRESDAPSERGGSNLNCKSDTWNKVTREMPSSRSIFACPFAKCIKFPRLFDLLWKCDTRSFALQRARLWPTFAARKSELFVSARDGWIVGKRGLGVARAAAGTAPSIRQVQCTGWNPIAGWRSGATDKFLSLRFATSTLANKYVYQRAPSPVDAFFAAWNKLMWEESIWQINGAKFDRGEMRGLFTFWGSCLVW